MKYLIIVYSGGAIAWLQSDTGSLVWLYLLVFPVTET